MDSPATVINAAFVTYVVVNAVMKTFSQHVMPLCFSGLRNYITKIQKGEGQSGKQYSARYICSLLDTSLTLATVGPQIHICISIDRQLQKVVLIRMDLAPRHRSICIMVRAGFLARQKPSQVIAQQRKQCFYEWPFASPQSDPTGGRVPFQK
eukprot:1154067-Pelagomonas_calceolata.AAC.8